MGSAFYLKGVNLLALLAASRIFRLGQITREVFNTSFGDGVVWFLYRPSRSRARLARFSRGGAALEPATLPRLPALMQSGKSPAPRLAWSHLEEYLITEHFRLAPVRMKVAVRLRKEVIGWWGFSREDRRSCSALSDWFELLASRTAQIARLDEANLENKALRLLTATGDEAAWLVNRKCEIVAVNSTGQIFLDAHFRFSQPPTVLARSLAKGERQVRLTRSSTGIITPVEPGKESLVAPIFLINILSEPTTRAKLELRGLSRAERAVHALICSGKTNAEIASQLGKAELTVQNQVHAILQKTGARDRRALMIKHLTRPVQPPSQP